MGKTTIVLAEDDQELGPQLKTLLEMEGYLVQLIQDGELALSHCVKHPPDLLVLDVGLPTLNGYQICDALRKANATTLILFLTERGAVPDRLLGFKYGADEYLPKPFDSMELLARIQALLRRSPKSRSRTFRFH